MKLLALFGFTLISFSIHAQYGLTSNCMFFLQQANYTNPAYLPECNFTFSGPVVGSTELYLSNSAFTLNAFLKSKSNIQSQSNVLDKASELNYLEQTLRRDWLQFSLFKSRRTNFSFNFSTRENLRIIYPKTLPALIFFGNGMTQDEAAAAGVNNDYAFLGKKISLDGLGLDFNAFHEIGFLVSRKSKSDRFSAGIRTKLLFGASSIEIKNVNLDIYTDPTDYKITVDGGYLINYTNQEKNLLFNRKQLLHQPFKNYGFGLDIGFSYKVSSNVLMSASIIDVGRISWSVNTNNTTVTPDTFSYQGIPFKRYLLTITSPKESKEYASSYLQSTLDTISKRFNPKITENKYSTGLSPQLYYGFRINTTEKDFLNFTYSTRIVRNKLRNSLIFGYNHRVSGKWGYNLNYNLANRSYLNIGGGLSFNLSSWQFYCLSDNVIAFLAPGAVKNAHIRLGINWTIGCKSDKDKDGVFDELDDCPEEPGLAQFKGCPDRDGDGIPDPQDNCPDIKGAAKHSGCPDRDGDEIIDIEDECPDSPGTLALQGCPDSDRDGIRDSEDECPTIFGIVKFMGCPDTDLDGIEDSKDECPKEPGTAANRGCPDRDNDGIIDSRDECPDSPGIPKFQGCPDTDFDGLPDHKDACPTKYGPKQNNGCPYNDRDGDGVLDIEDSCPDVFGPIANKGCPYSDLDGDGVLDKDDDCIDTPGPASNSGCPYSDIDGDGVLDKDDRCPQTPGVKENQGCPKLDVKEQEVINTAFEALEFETGKDVIKPESYPSLQNLADLLRSKPEWKIQLSGHTDNVGNDDANMLLSEKRAKSVGKFIESRGVNRDKIILQWFGETRPIADNNSPEGREKNRRVEMEIVFD